MQKITGWVDKGNTHVSTSGLSSTTIVQGSFPSATVTVYVTGTATLATLFSDNNTTPTPLANPFTATTAGLFSFYAANGTYDIVFSGSTITSPFSLTAIKLYDPKPMIFDVSAAPYSAKPDGTDSTARVAAAVADALTVRGAQLYFPNAPGGAIYAFHDIDLGDANGLTVCGDGAGYTDGNPAAFPTSLKYNGSGGTALFQVTGNAQFIHFRDVQLNGPNTAYTNLLGYGVQFLNAIAGNPIGWVFERVVFASLDKGVKFGSTGASLTNQMLWTTFRNCAFFSLNRAIENAAPNVQFIKFEECDFQNCWEYYIYATSAIDCEINNCYFGLMGPAAVAALYGPMILNINKIWSEITRGDVQTGTSPATIAGATAIPLIVNTSGVSRPDFASNLNKIYHPRRGDASGYSIYWDGGPFSMDDCSLGGLVRWDSRRQWNRVMNNNTSWIPCLADDIVQTVGTGSTAPIIIGDYSNATAADFYIEIVDPTHFRWKKTAGGSWSASTTIAAHVSLQENLIACFAPSVTWTTSDQWKLPCSITGLINFAGNRPEAFIGVKASRSSNVSLTSASLTTIINDSESADFQDLYGCYDSTTGAYTCMFHGRYSIIFTGEIDTTPLANGVPLDFTIFVYVNGSEVFHTNFRYSGNAAGVGAVCADQLITELYLNQNDVVLMKVKQTNPSSTALNFSGSANTSSFYIGRLADIANVLQ